AEDPADPGGHALIIDVEDLVGRVDVPEVRYVEVDVVAETAEEVLPVGFEEEEVLAVERGHVVRYDLLVIVARDRAAVVVVGLQELDEGLRLRLEDGRGLELLVGPG